MKNKGTSHLLSLPRVPEFINNRFQCTDFEKKRIKRIVISKDGEVILDLVRPEINTARLWEVITSNVVIKKQFYNCDGYVVNGLISRILNGLAYSNFERILLETIVIDSVGRSSDILLTRVIRYVVSYHDHLCDCHCISNPQILENLKDVKAVMTDN